MIANEGKTQYEHLYTNGFGMMISLQKVFPKLNLKIIRTIHNLLQLQMIFVKNKKEAIYVFYLPSKLKKSFEN